MNFQNLAKHGPVLLMLVGIPGSGKSTFIKNNQLDGEHGWIVLSTDNYIEQHAAAKGKTYSEAFSELIGPATNNLKMEQKIAVATKKNVVWDQTNLSKSQRQSRLQSFPKEYTKIAVVFHIPVDLEKRLASRPGKNIPLDVLTKMKNSFQIPTTAEGFSMVING